MAESKLLKVKDQLSCPVCLDTYVNPKQLQCFHVYCQDCLVKLVIRDQQGQLSLTCPSCRNITPVPPNGVRDLPAAFHINHLLDIINQSEETPGSVKEVEQSASFVSPLTQKDTSMCQEHNGKEYIYCKTCEKLICSECTRKGRKHHRHNYVDADIAFENMQKEILILLEPAEKQSTVLKEALDQIDTQSIKQYLINKGPSNRKSTAHLETFKKF